MDDKNNLKPKYFYHLDENKEDSFENLNKQSVDLIKNNDHRHLSELVEIYDINNDKIIIKSNADNNRILRFIKNHPLLDKYHEKKLLTFKENMKNSLILRFSFISSCFLSSTIFLKHFNSKDKIIKLRNIRVLTFWFLAICLWQIYYFKYKRLAIYEEFWNSNYKEIFFRKYYLLNFKVN